MTNIILCGVGGQGIILTSKLIAAASMDAGYNVMSAETIGMAQKGGSVFSFLRIGKDIPCPMFSKGDADLLIAFEPGEAVRMLPFLKKDGTAVVNTHGTMPVTAALKGSEYNSADMIEYLKNHVNNLITEDATSLSLKMNAPRTLNMIMLGMAVRSGALPVSMSAVEDAMERSVKPQFIELNKAALNADI